MGTMTRWFAEKPGSPINIVNKSDMMVEVATALQNIKKASIRDDLFTVPSDCQEMPSLQRPQMPGKKQ
jgi:adenylate kinase